MGQQTAGSHEPLLCLIGCPSEINQEGSSFFFKSPPISLNIHFRCQAEKGGLGGRTARGGTSPVKEQESDC